MTRLGLPRLNRAAPAAPPPDGRAALAQPSAAAAPPPHSASPANRAAAPPWAAAATVGGRPSGSSQRVAPLARAAGLVILRGAALVVTAVAVVLGGIGWLYLLRDSGAFAGGPTLAEALPLQRLAGDAAQPLVRVALAWLPAGLVAGALLARAGFARRVPRAALLFALGAALLMALGGLSDAITESDPLTSHVAAQPGRAAIWTAAALLAVGAAVPGGRRRA